VSEFLAMDGYARYVWLSYGVTFLIVILNIVWARRSFKRAREEARRRLAMSGEGR
jgi:heme exporter protein CcmD